ncbi:ATP-binding protein [Sulfurirhabdus autotrophica]|uniref:histidine kinase n=1 Tax=Sulfurirhabdus autotrophica TaxID=1706046 RepID=A0A4R3YAS9_9PROT|nr:ATP-binding protein [Sulfurirhabdus autotrophica]TCV87493.1 two-component system osmolarity sensor histidine kinase EnvZ [Sulfurirhabdus autotrophica]
MKQFIGSLYVRLVMVFLIALSASFATMYFLFLTHLEEARNSNFARSIATQVRLVEELLHSSSAASLPSLNGVKLSQSPPQAPPLADAEMARRLPFLKEQLHKELGRKVVSIPLSGAIRGMWINLITPLNQPQWMFIAMRKPDAGPAGPLLPALIVGFAVFLGGGMLLLWQIQRPLKQLGKALESVGESRELTMLPISGAGEIRLLSQRYNRMVDRLQRYEEDRSTMLAGVAHDLRTPITRLRLLIELAQSTRSGEMQHNLDDIERITEQFLIYARGNDDEDIELRNLYLFVEEVAGPYISQGVSIVDDQRDIVIPVRPNSLRRALINLIENALEYGSQPVTVYLSQDHDSIALTVKDSGAGIPQNLISRAMRPFTRLDGARGGKGHCGLGLGIASKIAEAHQGTLVLNNLEGDGFTASIYLPVLPSKTMK